DAVDDVLVTALLPRAVRVPVDPAVDPEPAILRVLAEALLRDVAVALRIGDADREVGAALAPGGVRARVEDDAVVEAVEVGLARDVERPVRVDGRARAPALVRRVRLGGDADRPLVALLPAG